MINKQEYTHYAKFYGIPCYFNEATNALDGRNRFYGFLLNIAIWVEKELPSNEEGFPIQITGEIL